jgi:hypothetical protein
MPDQSFSKGAKMGRNETKRRVLIILFFSAVKETSALHSNGAVAASAAGMRPHTHGSVLLAHSNSSSTAPFSRQSLADLLCCGSYQIDLKEAPCAGSGDMSSKAKEPSKYPRGHDIMWQSYMCGNAATSKKSAWNARLLGVSKHLALPWGKSILTNLSLRSVEQFKPDHPAAQRAFNQLTGSSPLVKRTDRFACLRNKKCA